MTDEQRRRLKILIGVYGLACRQSGFADATAFVSHSPQEAAFQKAEDALLTYLDSFETP